MLRILCVESNLHDAEIIRRLLLKSPLDFDFHCVESMREAINHSAVHRPDIVLMDIDLRDGRGPTMFDNYRIVYKDVPVIIVTASYKADVAAQVLDAGAFAFIDKGDLNLRTNRLFIEIEHTLRRQKQKMDWEAK